jgi:hypothetical protein
LMKRSGNTIFSLLCRFQEFSGNDLGRVRFQEETNTLTWLMPFCTKENTTGEREGHNQRRGPLPDVVVPPLSVNIWDVTIPHDTRLHRFASFLNFEWGCPDFDGPGELWP